MMVPGLYNMDCMEAMHQFEDGFFDLAIVDPPYGGGADASEKRHALTGGGQETWHTKKRGRFGGRFNGYEINATRTGETWASKYDNTISHWDVAPGPEYFAELARVSRHQIIWGGNYFDLPPTRCFLIWRKLTISERFSMAMCEYAWTSFDGNAKWIEMPPQGNKEKRFHPTQKPVALYAWQLEHYAKEGYKILDTHAGSASSLVACRRAGLDAWGFETDAGYYANARERLETEQRQVTMVDVVRQAKMTMDGLP